MMQTFEQNSAPIDSPNDRKPVVWGLTAAELHDAYWHARGVQCVRRGQSTSLQRAAELFLLVEPKQLVLFDLAALSERLTWHNALVTRLRLVDEDNPSYSEQVMLDETGTVTRVERRYRPRMQQSCRVVLTSSRKIAAIWMDASCTRDGWVRVRRSVAWSRVDHARSAGLVFENSRFEDEQSLIEALVERWPTPAQSIEGVISTQPGIWHCIEHPLHPDIRYIGPVWLGRSEIADSESTCVVGPAWQGDDKRAAIAPAATVRSIRDVELAEVTRQIAPHRPGVAYSTAKRTLDFLFSTVALISILPLMALIAAAIKLEDHGPVYFGHLRQGRGGRTFKCWKFRTMVPNAQQIARELDAYNICDGPQVYIQNDPRVTRIGRFLRASHLDELPQLWNVFLGQMSLVGPRPSPDDENQFCPAWRDARLSVRPGMTGLWQLYRRREPGRDFQEWIRYDLEYVRRAGFRLDLIILLRTMLMVVRGRSDHAIQ